MIQPVDTVTVTRPWGWGVATLHDAGYQDRPEHDVQAVQRDEIVELNLRHAQDAELGDQGEAPLAEATITVTSWQAEPSITRPGRVLHETVLSTPSRLLHLTDPEYTLPLPTTSVATYVRISGEGESWGDDQVWVDLWPAR